MNKPNTPYRKVYNSRGILTNPITKENPYLHSSITNLFNGSGFKRWITVRNRFFTGRQIA